MSRQTSSTADAVVSVISATSTSSKTSSPLSTPNTTPNPQQPSSKTPGSSTKTTLLHLNVSNSFLAPKSLSSLQSHYPNCCVSHGWIHIPTSGDDQSTIRIPERRNSKQTLEFLMFTPQTVDIIWNQFLVDPSMGVFHAAQTYLLSYQSQKGCDLPATEPILSFRNLLRVIGMNPIFMYELFDPYMWVGGPEWRDRLEKRSIVDTAVWAVGCNWRWLMGLESYLRYGSVARFSNLYMGHVQVDKDGLVRAVRNGNLVWVSPDHS